MLFQPTSIGIDIFDGRLGNLLTRISLPVALSPNYDALVSDGADNILVAITGNTGSGIEIIDLTSLPEPQPLPYLEASGHSVPAPLQTRNAPKGANTSGRSAVSARQHIPITVSKHHAAGGIFGKQ